MAVLYQINQTAADGSTLVGSLAFTPAPTPTPTPGPGPGPIPVPANQISAKGGAFSPKTLTVPTGTTVTWLSDDNHPLWIRGLWDAIGHDTPIGASYTHRFDLAGSYPYWDAYRAAPGGTGPLNGTIVVTGTVPVPGPTPVPIPGPIPPGTISVRDAGARGDGITDDGPAIQRALTGMLPGSTLYFPAGDYRLQQSLLVQQSGITLAGAGDAARLLHGGVDGLRIGGGGLAVTGVVVKRLQMVGLPGQFAGQGNNSAHAILCDGTRNILVQEVLFTGSAHCVYEVNQAVGVTVENCRVVGWGRVAFGLGDGATIRNNVLVQNEPDPTQKSVTYAFYPHNSCKNVLIEGNRVSGVGSYPVHYWAQADIGPGGPVTIRDNQFIDCDLGMFIGSGDGNVGRIHGLTIQRNVWRGKPHGSYVNLTNADDVLFEENTILSGVDPLLVLDKIGLSIGLWAPSTTNGLLTNAVFRNNRITGFDFGLYALASSGGRFVNCTVGPNVITDCRNPQRADPMTPGLTVVS